MIYGRHEFRVYRNGIVWFINGRIIDTLRPIMNRTAYLELVTLAWLLLAMLAVVTFLP